MLQFFSKLFLFVLLHGNTSTEPRMQAVRILGGNCARTGQFPYQISIELSTKSPVGLRRLNYVNICSGSLLASKWVVTSVNCLQKEKTLYRLVAGVIVLNDMSGDRQERVPEEFIIHPKYDQTTLQYDFGLIKVSPFSFTQYVAPIKLPAIDRPKRHFPVGEAEVAGYGSIDRNRQSPLVRLIFVKITLEDEESQNLCQNWFPGFDVLYHFCTFPQDEKSPCYFSNGSLLIQDGTIQGIISKIDKPCGMQSPTIYADVAKALDFFKKHIAE